MRRSLGGFALRYRHETEAESLQQVDAREAGPLAIRLEQLGGLPRLDPAAPQRRAELDEPEVAHQPALEAAEALETDDPDGPRPESALALEPGRARSSACATVGRRSGR